MSECDREASIIRRPFPSKVLLRHGGGIMKLMSNIATTVCWTIFNLSAACCSESLQVLYSIQFILVAKICTRLKKIIRFQERRPQWDLEKWHTQKQTVQDTLEGKLGALECDSGNVEVQWNNIKECVLDTLSDLVGKVEKRARKPWIAQEMISKMD